MNRLSRQIRPFLCILACFAAITTAHAQTRVAVISTAMHHVTLVQVPEPVETVAVGSDMIHVEWHDNNILVEPRREGVTTNMVVFTRRTTYLYEIAAATEPNAMSWLVKEKPPQAPPQPVVPSPVQVQEDHDHLYSGLLLTTRSLDNNSTFTRKEKKHQVIVRIMQVSSDEKNYYVRISATNNSGHTYRLQNPTVMRLEPAFGVDMAYKNVYRQLSEKAFKQFKVYEQSPVATHGSTLDMVDMPSDTTMDWVISLSKPEILPAVFNFQFPADQGVTVHAVAIF